MTGSISSPQPPVRAVDQSAPGNLDEEPAPGRAGVPARPGTYDGRARSFREEQTQRRGGRRELIGAVLAAAIITLGVYTIATAHPYSSSNYDFPNSGPLIAIHLGPPSVSTVSCGAGGTAYAEHIPWTNASAKVSTGEVVVHVSEIWDGDYIGDPGAVANATPTNLCAGLPPTSTSMWYVVLTTPNGTNLLTYTVASSWSSVSHGAVGVEVANGSAIVLVTHESLAGTGRGLEVVGEVNGSLIRGETPL
ncbi:MAG TPA: hypothetical protein VJ021_00010 [Thermoplasmata archaeon]|nr:hypothetical protein [Thermoplasmata archaeon]